MEWSKSWKASKQPRKQRSYVYNIPLHLARKLMSVHLVKDLRSKYHKRNIPVRKGDTVKVLSGQFKGKTGKVDKVQLKFKRVFVDNVYTLKRDGSKKLYPLQPSNLMITELNLEDKMRKQALEKK